MSNPQLWSLARRILDSEEVLLHVGPGILAGSDLPAAELEAAVWGDPDGRFSIGRFEAEPEAVWADWLEFWDGVGTDPTACARLPVHDRIAELLETGRVSAVVTENVYGLLEAAGASAEDVIEFHGRVDRARCPACGRSYAADPTQAVGNRRCLNCGRTLAPGVVLAGEPPARADRLLAWSRAESADVYLAVGTRLAVHPTAENAEHAADTGAEVVVVGTEPTPLEGVASERLRADPAETLARLRDSLAILG